MNRPAPLRAVAAVCLLPLAAFAQPARTPAAQTPPVSPAPPGLVEFAQVPLRLDSIGLVMDLPLDATLSTSAFGNRESATIVCEKAVWTLVVDSHRSSDDTLTVDAVAESALEQILSANGILDINRRDFNQPGTVAGTTALVLDRVRGFTIDGKPAHRFYVKIPPQRSGEAVIVRGLTALALGDRRFVTYDFRTTEAAFPTSRPQYEVVVATSRFIDAADLYARRMAAIETGARMLERVDDSILREVLASRNDQWERLFRPAGTGSDMDDTDLGYRRIRAWAGKRGEMNPARNAANYSPIERQEGYLVRMDARAIDSGLVIDSTAIYFLSRDRQEEAWSVVNGLRELRKSPGGGLVVGKDTRTITEVGARSGAKLSVSISGGGVPERTIKPSIQGEGYISRLESLLLPQILVKLATPADFGFYAYESAAEQIRLRRDSLDAPPDRPGLWRLTTRLHEDARPQTTLLTSAGLLIESQLGDGRAWAPTDLKTLKRLWEAKQLPMD